MWKRTRLIVAFIVSVVSLAYAIADYVGLADKISGRAAAYSGLARLSSTKGFPDVIIFNDEKEFQPLLKLIISNTKDQQLHALLKQGELPTAIARLGGPITVPGAGEANIDFDPRFVLDSSPIMVGFHYYKYGAEKGIPDSKRIGRPVGNLKELRNWIDSSRDRERFIISSVLIGILSLLVVAMEWRSED